MGKLLVIIGIVAIMLGIIMIYFPNAVKWFGNLPGDIKIEKENFKFYFPLVSMIVVSILFNVLLRIYRYFQ